MHWDAEFELCVDAQMVREMEGDDCAGCSGFGGEFFLGKWVVVFENPLQLM